MSVLLEAAVDYGRRRRPVFPVGADKRPFTDHGFKIAIFLTRAHQRLVRPGLAEALDDHAPPTQLRRRFDQLDRRLVFD